MTALGATRKRLESRAQIERSSEQNTNPSGDAR